MGRRPKSVMTDNMMDCYICGNPNTEVHHIFYGTANRMIADKYRYVIPLCYEHHRGTHGVHGKDGKTLDTFLKGTAQKHFEANIGTREDFISIFGKSWL